MNKNILFLKLSSFVLSSLCSHINSYMSKIMSIIQKQTLYLSEQFADIRETIQSQAAFSNLSSICSFNERKKSLTFKTEKIHPEKPPKNTKSVVLLFSNPHPLSVRAGMYLSESRSQAFWKRLFACECMQPSKELSDSISQWNSNTIDILSSNLLNPTYSDQITLFFDCLESLPTNQYLDLNKIFKKKNGKELRKKILQNPGLEHLHCVSKKNNITSWVVFSVQAYRNIIGTKNIAKNAPKRIRSAIDQYYLEKDSDHFWHILNDLKSTIIINNFEITVYLSLIARCKNDKTPDGRRYFTLMLDQIFKDITG